MSLWLEPLSSHSKFETVKWLRYKDCPCAVAALEGYLTSKMSLWQQQSCCSKLEVLEWLRENGCSWDKQSCLLLAKNHPCIIQWIQIQ